MHRRKWDAKTKAMIVIEGLKASPSLSSATSIRSAKPSTINGATSFWPMRLKPVRSMSRASVKRVSHERTPG